METSWSLKIQQQKNKTSIVNIKIKALVVKLIHLGPGIELMDRTGLALGNARGDGIGVASYLFARSLGLQACSMQAIEPDSLNQMKNRFHQHGQDKVARFGWNR